MKKIVAIIFLYFTLIYALEPIVTLDADKRNIYEGEKVNIILSVVVDKKDEKKIKFVHQETLNGEKIVKRAGKTSYDTVADGDNIIDVVQKEIIYTIAPKKEIKIGPLNLFIGDKEYKTDSLKIKIIKDKVEKKKKEPKKETKKSAKKSIDLKKAIEITLKTNKKSVTLYELFVVSETIKQPLNISIQNIEHKKPKFNGFELVKTVKKQGEIKDKIITKIDYILVPKKIGKLTISPAKVSFSLNIAPALASPFGFFDNQQQLNIINSNPLKINVLPVPKEAEIVGNYIINSKINKKIVKANEQIIYTITIKGEGNLEDLELPKLNIDNVTVYQDEPEIKKEYRNGKLLTIYKQKYVFISSESFTIPEITIKAYSPRFKQIYNLSTKKIDILVNSNINNTNNQKLNKKEIVDKNLNLIIDKNYYEKKIKEAESILPLILTFISGFILGALTILMAPKIKKLIKHKKEKAPLFSSYEEALHLLYPHTTKGKEYEAMVSVLYEVINGNKDLKVDNNKLNKLIKKIKKKEKMK